jgi:hypothetical protein
MYAQITRADIARLPHYGKVAFAARCARAAWCAAVPVYWQPPAAVENALRSIEGWGGDVEACQAAQRLAGRLAECLSGLPPYTPTAEEQGLAERVREVQNLPRGPFQPNSPGPALTDAISAAARAAFSMPQSPGQDDEAAGHAFLAYRESAASVSLAYANDFVRTVRADLNALIEYCRSHPSGAAPPELFNDTNSVYYRPLAADE